jgi:hypothetical protein
MASGRNMEVTATTVTWTVDNAAGQLIVSAEGSASVLLTVPAAALAGALYGDGSADITVTVPDADVGALLFTGGSVTIEFSTATTIRAVGTLAGDITPFTELSPESLAVSLWSASAASNNVAGSMGEKLNDAGSASNPWTEVIESGYTAAEVLRLIASAAVGLASGGPGSPVFRDLGDTKDRIVGTADSDGNRTAVTYDAT